MPEKNPQPASLDVIYSEVKERLDAQLHQVDTLDAKAGTILSVASVVMALAAGLQVSVSEQGIDDAPLALLIAGTIFYLATMLFAFRGYWLRNFRRDPEPRPLRDNYIFLSAEFTKRRVIANTIESFEVNDYLIRSKVWNLKVALILVAVETVRLVVALIFQGTSGV